MNDFEIMITHIENAKRDAERIHKRQKYPMGTYEDGYISALNYALTCIALYVEKKKIEIAEERKHDNTRN